MTTRLYFHLANNGLANLPTSEQSSLTADKSFISQAVNHLMDTTAGTSQTTFVCTTNGTASLQRYYLTRFVSNPLSGISSITAQTWTYNFAQSESNSGGNWPCAGTNVVRITAYIWRPGTQTKIGDILDGNSASTVIEATTINAERPSHTTFTGSSVASIQDGDVLCFEVWFEITQGSAIICNNQFFFDGTTVTSSSSGTTAVTNHASYLETPQDLTFGTAAPGTRLYFHAASNPLSNLPATEQSSLTADKVVDAVTVNRNMDTTIGTSQASLVLATNATASLQNYYFTRFVSDTLSAANIQAGDWIYNFSAKESSTSGNFPASGTGTGVVRVVLYIWRPGTQTVVGTIIDGDTNSSFPLDEAAANVQWAHCTTVTGSSVTGVQSGDVLICEIWFRVTQAAGLSITDTWYYDGTTIMNTPDAVVTNHASYLESPQVLVLGAPAGPVTCTVTGKTLYNKTTRHA